MDMMDDHDHELFSDHYEGLDAGDYAHPSYSSDHEPDPDAHAHAHDDTDYSANDDLYYDPDAHAESHNVDYDQDNDNIDYEPPSPSFPYPDDQLPPDSELQFDDLDARDGESRNPRHVSELYANDVTGNEPDQDNSVISEYLRSKDPDWDNVQQRTEPLNLLELPVDVLRLIVKEVCQTRPWCCTRLLSMPCLPSF